VVLSALLLEGLRGVAGEWFLLAIGCWVADARWSASR
jgi:hypothetical protein